MKIAFYKVNNSKDYNRHTFESLKPTEIKELLAELSDEELSIYDMDSSYDRACLQYDYNDECYDGGWWMVILEDEEEDCIDPATTTPYDDPAQDIYSSYSEDIRKAVAYINTHLADEDKVIIGAKVSKNFKEHMNPAYGIDEGKIIDLLEEYGEDHNLPEGWWMEEELDDIVLLINFEN